MIEQPAQGERAILVHVEFGGACANGQAEDKLREFRELAASAGAVAVGEITGVRKAPGPRYFVGSGKAEAIRRCAAAQRAELIIFDHNLTPGQERNLERLCRCRVVDRAGLILDIFAQRARSFEGKLQVELAQLTHLSTRLVRGWTHLERQKGGIGLRGPGETQLETDRRLIGARIKQIGKRLEKVRKQRSQSRQARQKAAVPTVALVGYTNAGKSTLFNRLTDAGVYTADQLFATLDPTLRRLPLGKGHYAVLADTVGFIRDLPHDLVAAFRATLQETREADLLLHVIDAHDDERKANIEQVDSVLAEIGADSAPQILIFNKIDRLGIEPRLEFDDEGLPARVWLSAETGSGLELLSQAVDRALQNETVHGWLDLPPQAGRVRSRLFEMGAVLREQVDGRGAWHLEVHMPRRRFNELSRREKLPSRALRV